MLSVSTIVLGVIFSLALRADMEVWLTVQLCISQEELFVSQLSYFVDHAYSMVGMEAIRKLNVLISK